MTLLPAKPTPTIHLNCPCSLRVCHWGIRQQASVDGMHTALSACSHLTGFDNVIAPLVLPRLLPLPEYTQVTANLMHSNRWVLALSEPSEGTTLPVRLGEPQSNAELKGISHIGLQASATQELALGKYSLQGRSSPVIGRVCCAGCACGKYLNYRQQEAQHHPSQQMDQA